MIFANGVPKSGTHLVLAAFDALKIWRYPDVRIVRDVVRGPRTESPGARMHSGKAPKFEELCKAPGCVHAHLSAKADIKPAKTVVIFRDPRNVLLSMARWKYGGSAEMPVALKHFQFKTTDMIQYYRLFLDWWDRSDALCIYYERFRRDPEAVTKAVAEFAGVDWTPAAAEVIGRPTVTWSGQSSDWPAVWNDKIDGAWKAAGGPALVEQMGYPP